MTRDPSVRRQLLRAAPALAVFAALGILASGATASSAPSVAINDSGGVTGNTSGKVRDVDTRIVGGGASSTARFPFQVAVVLDESWGTDDLTGLFCGGTLVTPRIVLTAAHCIIDTDPDCDPNTSFPGPGGCQPSDPNGDGTVWLDPSDANVILGRTVLTSAGGREHDLSGTAYPFSYNASTSVNDYGFLALADTEPTPPIKLAGQFESALWSTGRSAFITGWGRTSQGGNKSDFLKEARVGILRDPTCANAHPGYAGYDNARMVCAGILPGGTDTCQGDSGGPLLAPAVIGGSPLLRSAGVVSYGVGCAQPGLPGVYTEVAGNALRGEVQTFIDQIEATLAFPDAGTVYGSGAAPAVCAGISVTKLTTAGNDSIAGGARTDLINGYNGNDRIRGLGGVDGLCGGKGRDRLVGGGGRDLLRGGPGRDRLVGGPGRDKCLGGPGRDVQRRC